MPLWHRALNDLPWQVFSKVSGNRQIKHQSSGAAALEGARPQLPARVPFLVLEASFVPRMNQPQLPLPTSDEPYLCQIIRITRTRKK